MSRQSPVARVGDYHVLDFVGAGGMGEVFRAVNSRSGQVVAIKFFTGGAGLPPQERSRWRERFSHEARIQGSLHHPNLAAFYEWQEVGQTPCIVMELVDGTTLASRLQQGTLPLDEALRVFRGVVEGVEFMHAHGVIHRDIKSSNVKINGRGQIKLLDFGIAKTNDMPRLTATGAFIGTLQYLSPEQIKGQSADARCDVWALGVLFYEMLCGQPPFDAPTWSELLEKVVRAQFEPLRTYRPDVPRNVEAIVRRCLKKQPEARFANATELLSALMRLDSKGEGVPSSASEKAKLPVRFFNPVSYAVMGGTGVLLLVAWMLWATSSVTPIAVQNTALPDTTITTPSPTPGSGASGEMKTITVEVAGGAEETQVYRNGTSLGSPPCYLQARMNEQVEIDLSRPGFHSQHHSITVNSSDSVYSFTLEPLTP